MQDQGFAPGVNMGFSVFPPGPPAIEAMVGGSADAITVRSVPPLAAMYKEVADFREIAICKDVYARGILEKALRVQSDTRR